MSQFLIAAVAIIAIATPLSITLSSADSVQAQSASQVQSSANVEVPINTVVRGQNGSEYRLKTVNLENGEYIVKVMAANQSSVHPDSNIIVRSNGDEVRVDDVEGEAFQEAAAEGTLNVADGQALIYVQLGADKVFSGGVTVVFERVIEPVEPEAPVVPEVPEPPDVPQVISEKVVPAELPDTGAGLMLLPLVAGATYVATRRLQK